MISYQRMCVRRYSHLARSLTRAEKHVVSWLVHDEAGVEAGFDPITPDMANWHLGALVSYFLTCRDVETRFPGRIQVNVGTEASSENALVRNARYGAEGLPAMYFDTWNRLMLKVATRQEWCRRIEADGISASVIQAPGWNGHCRVERVFYVRLGRVLEFLFIPEVLETRFGLRRIVLT